MIQEKEVPFYRSIHSLNGNIYLFKEVASVLDEAFSLINSKKMYAWDSVLAKSQTGGRGQLRRVWQSPEGNLYAALHLPKENFYQDLRATPFLGFLCSISLRRMGWPALVKWPNDLVINRENPGKVGGILLEEKAGNFVVGIGLNLISSPPSALLRADSSLPSSHLSIPITNKFFNPVFFWKIFLKYFRDYFKKFLLNPHGWEKIYNNFLLWKSGNVEIIDGKKRYYGQLLGINDDGGIRLLENNHIFVVYNGSMKYLHK